MELYVRHQKDQVTSMVWSCTQDTEQFRWSFQQDFVPWSEWMSESDYQEWPDFHSTMPENISDFSKSFILHIKVHYMEMILGNVCPVSFHLVILLKQYSTWLARLKHNITWAFYHTVMHQWQACFSFHKIISAIIYCFTCIMCEYSCIKYVKYLYSYACLVLSNCLGLSWYISLHICMIYIIFGECLWTLYKISCVKNKSKPNICFPGPLKGSMIFQVHSNVNVNGNRSLNP